jgi:hypothetical protein
MKRKKAKKLIAGFIITVFSGVMVLLAGSALRAWNASLVKKIDLSENYLDRDEIDKNYVSKEDFKGVSTTQGFILEEQREMKEMLKAMIMHWNISYKSQQKSQCPLPPCFEKPRKPPPTTKVATDG